jgi:hypothetical protein
MIATGGRRLLSAIRNQHVTIIYTYCTWVEREGKKEAEEILLNSLHQLLQQIITS